MNFPKPKLDRDDAIKLWITEGSEYAKEQVILCNIPLVGLVMKSLNLSVLDDDLYSTGIIGLLKALNTFDHTKGFLFSTYAPYIIRNELLMTFRKKRVEVAFSLDDSYDLGDGESAPYKELIPDDTDIENEIANRFLINDAFEKMTDREKRVFYMSAIQGKNQCEIARAIGIKQSQVSRLIKKARERLSHD